MTTETALGGLVGRLAQADPDRRALTCGQDAVSRAELEARTNRLARTYRELGVRQDSFVTIGLPNGIEFFGAVLGSPDTVARRMEAMRTAGVGHVLCWMNFGGLAQDKIRHAALHLRTGSTSCVRMPSVRRI